MQFGKSAKHGNHDSGVPAELSSATKVSWKHFLRSCHSMGTTRLLKGKMKSDIKKIRMYFKALLLIQLTKKKT